MPKLPRARSGWSTPTASRARRPARQVSLPPRAWAAQPLAAAPVLALVFFSSLPLSSFELQPCSGRAALPPPGEQPRRARPERRLTWHRGAAAAQVCTPERREELLGRVRHHLTALKRVTCSKHMRARVEAAGDHA